MIMHVSCDISMLGMKWNTNWLVGLTLVWDIMF